MCKKNLFIENFEFVTKISSPEQGFEKGQLMSDLSIVLCLG